MFGYKPNVTQVATTNIDFYQQVPAILSGSTYMPDFNYALFINQNSQVTATTNPNISFLIEDPVDFTGNFIENALANPAKTAASAALAYFGMPYITEAIGAYALPYTEAFDAANLASQGLDAAAIAQNISATGLDSFLAADIANLASQGLAADQISQVLAYSYTPAELAGTGIKSLATGVNQGSNLTDIAKQALKANQAVGSLLSGQQVNPLQPMQSGAGGQIKRAGVDYSPTLSLLGQQRVSTPNVYSLLG
jgi:hypothetical protein